MKKKESPANYDRTSLQKLTEQYLVRTILEKDIYMFLQKHIKVPTKNVSNLLAEAAGKQRNSVYKNINEFTNYSASSLLRYWYAMVNICDTYQIPIEEVPSLDTLILKYKGLLDFIVQISVEHNLRALIDAHQETTWIIYEVYTNRMNNLNKPLSQKEKMLLNQLAEHPFIKQKIDTLKTQKIERLRKK